MAIIPDKMLMTPQHIAMQIRNAYMEGVADRTMNPDAPGQDLLDESIAETFACHYLRMGGEIPKET